MTVEESPGDVHWNANGHAIAGKKILEFMNDKELL